MFSEICTLIISIINIYIAYLVYELTKKDINPKLYVSSEILSSKKTEKFGKFANTAIILNQEDYQKKGFPESQHEPHLWQLSIHNNGNLPATNVKIEYSVIIKRAIYDFHEDRIAGSPIIDKYKTIPLKAYFDYIPPDGQVSINITYLEGYFLYADLIINSLQSNEGKFISQLINLKTYKHPHLNTIGDPDDSRKLYGVNRY